MINRRIVYINLGNFGSTGTIMKEIGKLAESNGFCSFYAYPDVKHNKPRETNDIIICSTFRRKVAEKLSYYTGIRGIWLYPETKRLLRKIDEIRPDIIHLNNLHDTYINLPLLFQYIKKHRIQVVWTLHDCWAFTGQCPHYSMVKCGKWKTGCGDCPQLGYYPRAAIDQTKVMWCLKRKWFTSVANMKIVTPSQWLANQVRESYLNSYPVYVINNGIDLSVFKPMFSRFKEENELTDKFIVLGVSTDWSKKKGLDIFIELAAVLDDMYQIVLVGTDDSIDSQLPMNVVSIHRTHDQKELAQIYSAADVFVNATREEVLGLVNIEALACGTPVITFDAGGSPECISLECGYIVENGNVEKLSEKIQYICKNKPFSSQACIERAKLFEKNQKYSEYIDLYNDHITGRGTV